MKVRNQAVNASNVLEDLKLTGSGNLRVCIQELGNEGSERLNVDVGSTVSQLPSALTGEGNLKVSIQEDHTHDLATASNQTLTNSKLDTINTTNTSNNSALVSIRDVNLPQIHNDLVGVSGFTSGSNTALVNIRDINLPQIHNDLVRIETNQTDGTQLAKVMGSQDGTTTGTQKQIAVNSSGQLNVNVVNSVNTEIHGHTDISDTNTSVRLLANALGHLVISEAPTTYENVSLGTPTTALSLSGSDTIDLNGFRNIFVAIRITATTGGSCNDVHLLASNDNSNFVITGDKLSPTEARTSGVFEAGGVFLNLGYRYLKLGSNNGVSGGNFVTSVSAMTIHTNRFNGAG